MILKNEDFQFIRSLLMKQGDKGTRIIARLDSTAEVIRRRHITTEGSDWYRVEKYELDALNNFFDDAVIWRMVSTESLYEVYLSDEQYYTLEAFRRG